MTTPHEAVAAWPVTGNADKALARALSTRRLPYPLSSSESAADLVVVDPATGVIPLYLVQNGTLFEYDSLDSTTVASAVCLVTGDAKRYKSGGITPPYSVLTVGTTAQPASPSIGNTYLIPTAATGTDWAGKDGKIGIYSRAGWQFVINPVGRSIYAEDTNIRWYRNAAGTWVSGFGAVSIGAGGVNITNMLGAKASFVVKVENQTTAAAPASPVAPVAYIVAGSGGAWSAYSPGDLAVCLVDGTFTRIVPATGDVVYDKALALSYVWSGSAWQTNSGELIATDRYYAASTTWNKPARLAFVDVVCIGGGGGSRGNSDGGAGGTSSFGAHISSPGGGGGTTSGAGTGGTTTGGDYNPVPLISPFIPDAVAEGLILPGAAPAIAIGSNGCGGAVTGFTGTGRGTGGAGAAGRKRVLTVSLGSSEAVTIGAAGTGSTNGNPGIVGLVHVREYTRA